MSPSRKHFIELARIVRHGICAKDRECVDCLGALADKLADFCAKYNPDFDRKRFLKACKPRKGGE